ncbi:Protein of unknown function (DUF2892) [Melghirimyces profundicolus]|uniref:Inner membrane protein YgaP-like transmembrane domain-containing protein n=1 Tax=Melghirimyces profundicolus TaxID=1242148 RepID=A0A2T6B3P1_9BACL|nr:DUF2892 domain-containing protein [Melghirimyces profundicolus]PTX50645.1 Protein of unknown function (DUF2892) [Melghirimyces profundicolus]
MQKNVGTWDAIMRITVGLTGLAWSTSRMVRRPHSLMPLMTAMLSGMKTAEGITRFCPMLYVMGISTREVQPGKRGQPTESKEGF